MNFGFFKSKKNLPEQNKKVKIGLALGGGASKGIAHIGAIKAFEENNIKFDFVAGTSVGSLIGAMYAQGKSSKEMLEIAKSLKVKDIRSAKFFMPSKTDNLQETIIEAMGGKMDILNLKTPFCAVAVDLITGKEVLITKGDLATACAGSCAIPGVFVPVEFMDMHLIDGGVQNNIPSDVPRYFGCDYVIAIDVNSTRGGGTDSTKIIDVLKATIGIMGKSNCIKGYSDADIVIQPKLTSFSAGKLDGVDEMFMEGYQSTLEVMPKILELISKKPKRAYKKKYKERESAKPFII